MDALRCRRLGPGGGSALRHEGVASERRTIIEVKYGDIPLQLNIQGSVKQCYSAHQSYSAESGSSSTAAMSSRSSTFGPHQPYKDINRSGTSAVHITRCHQLCQSSLKQLPALLLNQSCLLHVGIRACAHSQIIQGQSCLKGQVREDHRLEGHLGGSRRHSLDELLERTGLHTLRSNCLLGSLPCVAATSEPPSGAVREVSAQVQISSVTGWIYPTTSEDQAEHKSPSVQLCGAPKADGNSHGVYCKSPAVMAGVVDAKHLRQYDL